VFDADLAPCIYTPQMVKRLDSEDSNNNRWISKRQTRPPPSLVHYPVTTYVIPPSRRNEIVLFFPPLPAAHCFRRLIASGFEYLPPQRVERRL
jgi:hypothetical protein